MSKGKVLIISIILVFLGLVSFLIYQVNYKKSKYLYLFTGETEKVRWYYNDNTWYTANTNKILKEKFKVYMDGRYTGDYYLVYSDRWYFFDDNNNSVDTLGNFMINTNFDFNSSNFVLERVENKEIIDKLRKRFIASGKEYEISLGKISIDNNSTLDELYVVSFKEKSNEYEVIGPDYSAIFTYKNNKMNFIREMNFLTDNSSNRCYLNLEGVFTFENKNTKLLVSCLHYDITPNDYYLYEKKGNKYNVLIDTIGGGK